MHVTGGIYVSDDRGVPDLVGSAVLMSLGTSRFLLTAGHVMDLLSAGHPYVGAFGQLRPIVGAPLRLVSVRSQNVEDDRIDVGAVRLSGAEWEAIPENEFASWNELDYNGPILSRHTVAVVGYPVSKNRKPPIENTVNAFAYQMAALECPEKAYRENGLDPKTTLMLGFDRDRMWGPEGMHAAPNLHGASGCGMWRFGRRLREATGSPLLAAIATEWHQRKRPKHILGTRIHLVIAGLVAQFPDVRAFVEDRFR